MSLTRPLLLHIKGDTRFDLVFLSEGIDVEVVTAPDTVGRNPTSIRTKDGPTLNGEKVLRSGRAYPVLMLSKQSDQSVSESRVHWFLEDSKLAVDLIKQAREFSRERSIAGKRVRAERSFHPRLREYIVLDSCAAYRGALPQDIDHDSLLSQLHDGQGLTNTTACIEDSLSEAEWTSEEEAAFWYREVGYDIRNRYRTD